MCRPNLNQDRSRGPQCHHKPAQRRHLAGGGMITHSLTYKYSRVFPILVLDLAELDELD